MWKWMIALSLIFSASLQAETKMLAFAGSSREDSVNKKLIAEIAYLSSQTGVDVTVIDLKDFSIPFYDADLEIAQGMPSKAKELRQLMIQSQIIVIASPEYNASVSPLLKNAIDWSSRNEEGGSSRAAFKDKKFILMSASPGSGGGARGLVHLQAIIEDIGGTVVSKHIVVPHAYNAFDEQGHLKSKKLIDEIKQLLKETRVIG